MFSEETSNVDVSITESKSNMEAISINEIYSESIETVDKNKYNFYLFQSTQTLVHYQVIVIQIIYLRIFMKVVRETRRTTIWHIFIMRKKPTRIFIHFHVMKKNLL